MTQTDKIFRRNLLVATICHVALIAGIFLFEAISSHLDKKLNDVILQVAFIPADYLGDMPKGEGTGRGDWAPAPPATAPEASQPASAAADLAPTETDFAAEETVDPAKEPAAEPGDFVVPKKETPTATKPKPKPVAVKKTTAKTTKKTAPVAPVTQTTTTKGTSTSASKNIGPVAAGPSAADIRNRFAGALRATAGGTPYGDGRRAGGGEGRSSVIGSPNGSPDGMVGGVGKGSPFWSYYQHVHDRMYEAWTQPGQALNWDKNLVTTIKLVVARDGSVVNARILNASGNRIMDDSVLSAVDGVPRLKPLPDGLGGMTADITVNFRLEG